jgi:V/A-type H+-transporting ATPase subunit C
MRQGLSVDQRSALMIKGGKLSAATLRQAEQAADGAALLEILRRANGFDDTGMDEALAASNEQGTLDPIVSIVTGQRMSLLRKMSLLNPVSAFPVIHYIESKVTEVRNLRLLARGKAAGLEIDVLEAHLLI